MSHTDSAHTHDVSNKTPILIFVELIFLTILTVGLSGIDVSNTTAVIIAFSIATIKASLVLMFFMHIQYEPAVFKYFLAVAFFTLLAIFILLFSDYSFRS